VTRISFAAFALATLGAALASGPSVARAQTPEGDSVIDRRFQEALDALDAGKWDEACPRFREVLAAEATVAVLFKVAKCSEHEEKIAQAWAETNEGLRMNERAPDGERKTMLQDYGRMMLRQLEPRIARVAVRIEGGPPAGAISVKRDGRPVAPDDLREPLVVERGAHELTADAAGFERATERVDVGEGETKTVVLRLRQAPTPIAPPKRGPSPLLVTGAVLGGLGVAALGVGIGTGVRALDLGAELTARCPDPARCDQTGVDLADAGALFTPLSTSMFVVGGALAAASVPLLVIGARRRAEPHAAPPIALSIAPASGGLALRIAGALP